MIYQKDIFRMMEVVNKTCLNWETFRTRQEIYLNSFSRQENSIKNNHQSSETVLALEKENKSQFFRVVKSKTEVKKHHIGV